MRIEIKSTSGVVQTIFTELTSLLNLLNKHEKTLSIQTIKVAYNGNKDKQGILLKGWFLYSSAMQYKKVSPNMAMYNLTPLHIGVLLQFWQRPDYPSDHMIQFVGLQPATVKILAVILAARMPETMKLSFTSMTESQLLPIIAALTESKSIKKLILKLPYNQIKEKAAIALAKLLCTINCIKLDLANNEMNDTGALALIHAITAGCTLEELDLSNNLITDITAIQLASALKSSACKLTKLTLAECKFFDGRYRSSDFISDAGCKYLNNAVMLNYSLRSYTDKTNDHQTIAHLEKNETQYSPAEIKALQECKLVLANLLFPQPLITIIYDYLSDIDDKLLYCLKDANFSLYYYLQYWYQSNNAILLKLEQELFKLFLPDFIRNLNRECLLYLTAKNTDVHSYPHIQQNYIDIASQWIGLLPQKERQPFINLCIANKLKSRYCIPQCINKLFAKSPRQTLMHSLQDKKLALNAHNLFIPEITQELKTLKKLFPVNWLPHLQAANVFFVKLSNKEKMQQLAAEIGALLAKFNSTIQITEDATHCTVNLSNVSIETLDVFNHAMELESFISTLEYCC